MSQTGKIILDIPPKAGNPRNSEGAFIDLKDGRIVFMFSRFNGEDWADNAPSYLARIESSDQGETWSEEHVVITSEQDKAQNIMGMSFLRLQNDDIGLFYFICHGFENGKEHLRRSSDEGQTWSDPQCCIPARGYYVTNHDRVVRLRDGRLIIPAGYHRTIGSNSKNLETWDYRSITIFLYSDDDGQSWHESNLCTLNVRGYRSGLQEPGLIELKNGSLYGWARTDVGMQYEMFSHDRGASWTVPQPSGFSAPCSPLSMKRDPGTGNLVAVWNPVPNYITRPKAAKVWNEGRTPLVCTISRDDGLTWEEPIVLEDDPTRGYCYTAMHFIGDDLLLAYCAGGTEDGGCNNRLRIRKLPIPR